MLYGKSVEPVIMICGLREMSMVMYFVKEKTEGADDRRIMLKKFIQKQEP